MRTHRWPCVRYINEHALKRPYKESKNERQNHHYICGVCCFSQVFFKVKLIALKSIDGGDAADEMAESIAS